MAFRGHWRCKRYVKAAGRQSEMPRDLISLDFEFVVATCLEDKEASDAGSLTIASYGVSRQPVSWLDCCAGGSAGG